MRCLPFFLLFLFRIFHFRNKKEIYWHLCWEEKEQRNQDDHFYIFIASRFQCCFLLLLFFSKNICTRSKQYAFVLVSQQSIVQRTKRTMPNSISKRIESNEIDTKCIYGVEDERNDMMAFYLLSECRCMFMYTVTFPYASAIAIICLVSHFYIEKNRKRSSDERKKNRERKTWTIQKQ